jgi:hypothetical protein
MRKEYVIKLGYEACKNKKPVTANPFAHGSLYSLWWAEGWCDAYTWKYCNV